MPKAIAGFFRTQAEGEGAQEALLARGFSRDEISFLAGDTRGHETPAVGPALKGEGSDSEASSAAWIGGAVGLAAGVVALSLPGIGPLIAAGPLAGALGGLAVGTATGGVIGLLKDHGISDEEAEFYAEGVKRGGALITVHGIPDDREKVARKILDDCGAIKTEELSEEFHGSLSSLPRTQ